jgi:hypothetical protein
VCPTVAPVDCVLSSATLGACSVTCGGGTQNVTKTITTAPTCGGAACAALLTTQACNTQACPVDCVYGTWTAYGACSTTCGGAGTTMTRTRTVVTNGTNGGIACTAANQTDTTVELLYNNIIYCYI